MFNKKVTPAKLSTLYAQLNANDVSLSEPMYDIDEKWHALSEVGRGDRVVSSYDRYKDGKIDVNP